MIIKGLQKTTLLDFPGKVACTVFTGGCNFRCPFCHNASLVLSPAELPDLSEEEFFDFLTKRRGILDGVCITGGEPLLQKDIIPFLERIRALGFGIKLDTNGSFPEKLRQIVDLGLVDYIAMDIKNCREKYDISAGTGSYTDSVFESIEYIMSCGIPYEFRTTVVKELHTSEDILNIAKSIKGANGYFLQTFEDSGELIGSGFSAHDPTTMKEMLELVKPYVKNSALRGV